MPCARLPISAGRTVNEAGRSVGGAEEDRTASSENFRIYEESWSEWLDMKLYGPSSRWLRALILDALHPITVDLRSVLDVGCGEGTITKLLSGRFPKADVLGVDQSSEAIRLAGARYQEGNLSFRLDPGAGADERQFDLVACMEVLEHVDDWQMFLDGLCDGSGRFLLLSFPTGRMRPFERHVGHVRNFRPGEVEEHLRRRGFIPGYLAYAGFPFYSPLYREMCQLTNAGTSQFTRGRYSWKQKAVAEVIFFAFRRLSTQRRWGDQFVGLFERSEG